MIVLDYDETFTRYRDFFVAMEYLASEKGIPVVCCTMRFGNFPHDDDVKEDMEALGIPVVYAGMFNNKWDAMIAAGYDPEDCIWIDDYPKSITQVPISQSIDADSSGAILEKKAF